MNRKIALITGVSRLAGIGCAICMELARQGYDIFFTYWPAYDKQMPWGIANDEPTHIENTVRKIGVQCEKLELDLTLEGAASFLLKEVQKALGSPLVLVNNATYSTQTPVHSFSAIELDKHYEVNVKATTLLTMAFINGFPFTEGGRIINLSSGQSLGEMPNEIAYAITKGAIETLTKTISSETARKGITINAVNPGPTDTGWMDVKLRVQMLEKFPMNRIGSPQDAARLVAFLVSTEAQWITGQIVHSEGGFTR